MTASQTQRTEADAMNELRVKAERELNAARAEIAELREALTAVIKDLEFRAKIIDPDEPVLDIGNGVLMQARRALGKE